MLAGGDGSLWIGSPKGLWRKSAGDWEHFTTSRGLSHDAVTALHEDRAGVIWIGTSAGLNRLEGRSIRAYPGPEGIRDIDISAIAGDLAGDLWIGTRTGQLYRLHDGRLIEISQGPDQGSDSINAILAGDDGSIWVGTWRYGLARLQQGMTRIYTAEHGLSEPEILGLAEDRWGRIWIGTRDGLFLLRDEPAACVIGGVAVIAGVNATIRPVSHDATNSLLRDRSGSIWIGGGSGLHHYKDWRLNVYLTDGKPHDRNVVALHPARDGGVWVSLTGGGLARLRDGKVVARYGEADGLSSRYVTSICETRDGTLWVGTWGHGLNRFEGGRFVPTHESGEMSKDVIRSIFEDADGDLWIGTWGSGLRRLRHGRLIKTYTTQDGLADNQVRVMAQDSSKDLWIATYHGLSRFHDGELTTYTKKDGLSEDSIFCLRPDTDGSLWIGTWGGGLNRFRDGRFTSYTTKDGLHCDTICEILIDGEDLWMGSPKGIFRVNKAALEARDDDSTLSIASDSYGTAEGMVSAQCNRGTQPSGCRTPDGRIWFATIDGVVMVEPRLLPSGDEAPAAVVVQVRRDHKPVDDKTTLRLTSGRVDIEFLFTAPTLQGSDKALFQYQLQGFDDAWEKPVSDRSVHYNYLPSGHYDFKVHDRHGNGDWGPASLPSG